MWYFCIISKLYLHSYKNSCILHKKQNSLENKISYLKYINYKTYKGCFEIMEAVQYSVVYFFLENKPFDFLLLWSLQKAHAHTTHNTITRRK